MLKKLTHNKIPSIQTGKMHKFVINKKQEFKQEFVINPPSLVRLLFYAFFYLPLEMDQVILLLFIYFVYCTLAVWLFY